MKEKDCVMNQLLFSAIRDDLIILESLGIAFNRGELGEYGIKRCSDINFSKMTKWYVCVICEISYQSDLSIPGLSV